MDSGSATNSSQISPKWLDTALIQVALRSGGGEDANITVKNITISRATAPGDNYSSVIYRVNAKLSDDAGERSLLVKAIPEEEAVAQAISDMGVFPVETQMLGKYIPAMEALLNKLRPGQYPPFAAHCPLHGTSPVPFIMLEDLKPLGFRMAERHRGLGLRHSLMAVRSLARFHATSAALLQKDPSILNDFKNPFRSTAKMWEFFLLPTIQMCADACRKWPNYEEYADALGKFKHKAIEILGEINDPVPGKFNVLMHGDFWINNMMYKYDSAGNLNELRVVDLQVAHPASPSLDLHYFLSTSLSEEVWDCHKDLLLREYHVELSEILTQLGLQGPSFKELMADFNARSAHGLVGALCVWPLVHAEEIPDVNAVAQGNTTKNRFMFESETVKNWLQRLLPDFKRRGWLEF